MTDTIFALASGRGRAGVAVIRVSGPAAAEALIALTGAGQPQPRVARRTQFLNPVDGSLLDDGLALWFPAPDSFTGEDVCELHGHGGPAVVAALLAALGRVPGLRPAEAGEFTRRAFESGKLDLTAAEGLADLIAAETEAQRRQARRQADGELGRLYEDWRARLVRALALIEAEIDFFDEDLPGGLHAGVLETATALDADMAAHLDDNHRGERLRGGLYLAIVGAPNVGKSSLLNLLARRDAAIVSGTAGTTRDVIEAHLDLGGYPLCAADTAGLNAAAADEIESEGIRRALLRAADADLKLAVFDASAEVDAATAALIDGDTLVVFNKCELAASVPESLGGRPVLALSVKTGDGVAALEHQLIAECAARLAGDDGPALSRPRHRAALTQCRAALARFRGAADIELAAEDLRLAARSLGRITGRVDVEDLLDVIFSEFCIGK